MAMPGSCQDPTRTAWPGGKSPLPKPGSPPAPARAVGSCFTAVNEEQMLPCSGGATHLNCSLINLSSGTFPYIYFILFLTGTFTD